MTVPLAIWLRATWLGWLLGVPLVVLLALAAEAVGIGGALRRLTRRPVPFAID